MPVIPDVNHIQFVTIMVLPILNFLYSRILKILQKNKTLDIKNYRKDTSWNQCKSSKNVSLRYSSSFRRNIEIPFTKRELESELNWVENYIIAELNRDITDADDDNVTKNPTTRILLQIISKSRNKRWKRENGGRNLFDQPINSRDKIYENLRRLNTGQEQNFTVKMF